MDQKITTTENIAQFLTSMGYSYSISPECSRAIACQEDHREIYGTIAEKEKDDDDDFDDDNIDDFIDDDIHDYVDDI